MGLNKFMGIGNLTRDPENTFTQGGLAVCKFSIAINEKWKDQKSGQMKEKVEYARIVFFGKQAETIGRYMTKGSQIYVEGKLQTSQYEKDGITRYTTEIMGNNFQFIGGGKNQQQNSGRFQQQNNGGFQQQPQGGFQQPQNNGGFQQGRNDNFGGQESGFQGPPDDD